MNKRKFRTTDNAIYVGADALAGMLDCGRAMADRVGIAAGAKIKIGGCARYNLDKIKKYLEECGETVEV